MNVTGGALRRMVAGGPLSRLTVPAGMGLAALAVVGCSAPPVASPPVPTFPAASTTFAATTSASPRLAADCGALISAQDVDLALGQPLVGRIRGVVGVPEPKINRLERVTCQYGLPAGPPGATAPVPPLEISVSRYADAASAAARVNDTIEAERARGAAPSTVPVAGVSATVLVGADKRLLVAVSGAITVAVTLAPGVADDRAVDVLADLGGRVLTAVT